MSLNGTVDRAFLTRLISNDVKSYRLSYLENPGFGNWRLGEDTCRFLGSVCEAIKPRTVVEFGSGLSSLILAHEISKGNVGKVFSIDHLGDFPGHPRALLGDAVKQGVIEFHHCPIGPTTYGGKWFQFCVIPTAVLKELKDVDLVLIDGPPYYYESREAALYAVYPSLSPNALILLDDAARETREQVYLKNWSRYYGENIETALFVNQFKKGLGCAWKTGLENPVTPFPFGERLSHSVKFVTIGAKETIRRLRD